MLPFPFLPHQIRPNANSRRGRRRRRRRRRCDEAAEAEAAAKEAPAKDDFEVGKKAVAMR